ncbi:antibiotic biosynthesis monooxygenase family protein [Frankia gtarii]|uniref:antibiotic biosynthesis monooxygenase family protein n=1 Tax=Frankia gtarii TaxID=2950102 RepID=UPI0021C010D1|nr:antibiotic biosynthesis monooxygenase family protein [Frankia gtarii]
MSLIRVEDGYLALFNIFHTDEAQGQDRLIDTWRSLPPAHTQPGLVAGNFHRGIDGRSVINYAQWESQDAYDAFIAERGTQGRLNEALTFSRLDSITSEVVHAWDPPPQLSLAQPWFTVVLVIKVEPENQGKVIKSLADNDSLLGATPGHVSHAVHRGLSGDYVIEYGQWADEESFRAFLGRLQEQPSPLEGLVTYEAYLSRLEYIRGRS